ncbi:unnamed protein product [Chondrus crispus]|uniref:GS catalytic domain-containing protein n=1 Tax=Chondrus crispus TaxID=2769 RepID=R7QBL6_CHOCR|nr:unnamed protein product [Chondrus crispus]CDF34816.1 unnamed protein product [Chondrus crispus]|eukprot:XP_005714635.1 unnamed protein product [Chondrus crispus]
MARACMVLMPWLDMPSSSRITPAGSATLIPMSHPLHKAVSAAYEALTARVRDRVALPWHPNHEVVLSKMRGADGEAWEHCPKGALLRAVDLLAAKGLFVQAGFELEFALFTQDGSNATQLTPYGRGTSYALFDQMDMAGGFLDDVTVCLEQMGVEVAMVHAEASTGQYEVVLRHKAVLQAVQDVTLARMGIKAVARKHGLVTSFVPNFGDGLGGSGCHVHLSLDGHFGVGGGEGGKCGGVSETGQQWMAGILAGLPWAMCVTNGSCLSYLRMLPMYWAGAYQVWGVDNKEAALRLAEDRSNVEVKALDSVSNVDLAMAGLLLAGLQGVEAGMELPEACQVDPHTVQAEVKRLPGTLEESVVEFEEAAQGGRLERVFTKEMVHEICSARVAEIEFVKKVGIKEFRKRMMTLH